MSDINLNVIPVSPMENTPTYIPKTTLMRIKSDVSYIQTNPLTSHGIHYCHDECDILQGYVLIIGSKGTPYENGYYLFHVKFPINYPYSPPVITFYTSDGITRFNPNLYRSGKVCLSLLGTWSGPQWNGCQTLTSILLGLCTIFVNNPLLNEPGIDCDHIDFNNYNALIEYKNIEVAIIGVLKSEKILYAFRCFIEIMVAEFNKNADSILNKINLQRVLLPEESIIHVGIYRISLKIDYNKLYNIFTNCRHTIGMNNYSNILNNKIINE